MIPAATCATAHPVAYFGTHSGAHPGLLAIAFVAGALLGQVLATVGVLMLRRDRRRAIEERLGPPPPG
ncbi:hypothetical protein NJLHNGOC_06910 [Novacetimonas cocois]|uniref:Uncharacterized protein n=1 Tax=Novacetimonas cocois TaxID=1747507 RepID=A0A365YZ70_9PROT|nr:hypothetical protein NJLHNGOC_06910 [Novacetimonas cocois]